MLKQIMAVSLILVSCKSTGGRDSTLRGFGEDASGKITKRFDFTEKKSEIKDFGIDFFYSDYPYGQETSKVGLPKKDHAPGKNFYQLTQHFGEQGKFKGQVIAYSNRSDDVDTNLQITIGDQNEKLKANTIYLINAKLSFVSNSPLTGSVGAGGAPNATSFGMIATQSPWSADIEAKNFMGIADILTPEQMEEVDEATAAKMTKEDVRAFIIKHKMEVLVRTSTVSTDGKEVYLREPHGDCQRDELKSSWICKRYSRMGAITNGLANDFQWKEGTITTAKPVEFKTDASGKPIYVNLVSHSGYEGVTNYLLTGVEVEVSEK